MNHFSEQQILDETRRFFQKVYGWMCLALVVSGLTAFWVASSPALIELILLNRGVFFAIIIVEVLLVIGLVALIERISAVAAGFMFLLYSFMTGLTLSVIFLVFTIESIGLTFFITAGMFGAMSVYGFFTKADLTRMGQILYMALFGIIIGTIVNIFLRSAMTDFIISIFGVIIFTGLTAYDTQKIKKMNIIGNEGTEEDTKEAIRGALKLYLDFINLFLYLLRFLGKRK